MNDLELIRELRSEVPVPGTARLASGRSALLEAAHEQARFAGRPARANRTAIKLSATAAAVVVVAGLAGYGIAAGVRRSAAPAASRTAPTAAPQQATLAARILRAASVAAERVPVKAEPSPHQWIYSQMVTYEYNQGNLPPGCAFVRGPKPGQTQKCDAWTRFDGNANAFFQRGHLVVWTTSPAPPEYVVNGPKAAYDAMASLPKNPRALLAAAGKAAKAYGLGILEGLAGRGSSLTGDYLAMLLWNAAGGVGGPPQAEAAVFHAMATLPRVNIQQGITDITGAQAIGVSFGGFKQLLLDPVSYQVIGLRAFNPGRGPMLGWPKHGGLIVSEAYTQVREVSGPGIR